MPSPVVDATLQAAGLSLISNLCAQFIQAHQTQQAPNLELRQLVRFLALQLITTPPNFQWQIYLEKRFPAYLPSTRGPRNKKDKDELELRSLEEAARVGYGSEPLGPVAVAPYKFSMRNTMMKWFVDCFTAGAIVNTVAFLVIMGMMKGQRVSQICDNVRTETIPIMVSGYKIWPLASFISFVFIPVQRRIVFLNFVGLLWGIYMSLVAARV